jgi:hypothetical protein
VTPFAACLPPGTRPVGRCLNLLAIANGDFFEGHRRNCLLVFNRRIAAVEHRGQDHKGFVDPRCGFVSEGA